MTDETPEAHRERLTRAYMQSIDEALDALAAFAGAVVTDAPDLPHHRERARAAWATFGELLISRCDNRTAHMLLTQLRQVDAMMRVVEADDAD